MKAPDVHENASAGTSFCKEGPMTACTQPVAGPFLIKVVYNLLVLCVMVFFVLCIVNAAPTWAAPMVQVNAKFMTELTYPDVYMCIPPLGMMAIIEDKLDFSIMGLTTPKSGATVCRGFSEMSRVRVSLTMDQDFVSCQSQLHVSNLDAITEGYIFTNEQTPSDMTGIASFFQKAKDIAGGNPFHVNDNAVNLAKSLGTFKDPSNAGATEYEAFCFAYTGSNLTAKYDSNNVLMNVNALKLNMATAAGLLYLNAYFVPPEEKPYKMVDGKYVVTATSVLWPLKNALTQGQLTTEVITDTSTSNKRLPDAQRVYSEKPTTVYKVSVNSQPTRLTVFNDEFVTDTTTGRGTLQMVDSVVYGANSLRFGSFVQQNIMIRDKTYAEIWAEIGGLWAGAALIITFLFKSSGYTTEGVPDDIEERHGTPLLVARFLPGGMVTKHLAAYHRKNNVATVAAAEGPT